MEVDGYLRIKIEPNSDGTGKLTVEVASDGFGGRGEAYFDLLRVGNFAQQLQAFPLSQERPPFIEGGFWSKEQRGVLEQIHLSIQAYQIGNRGQVGLRVKCADPPLWPNDRQESQNQALVEVVTTYAALERFGKDLELLVASGLEEAVLNGLRF